MARTPLTLAASVTAALPGVAVVSAASITSHGEGRYDSALVTLDDGRRLVVRAPVDDDAARELATEALALRALTPGARALLPFRAPEPLGEIRLAEGSALVVDLIEGYRVDAADLPAGPGAAPSVGQALASLHALPESVVRAEGLPRRTAAEIRSMTGALLERAERTRRLPVALSRRWQAAVDDDELWRFESRVILGETTASSFVFDDIDDVPTVVGVLGWHGLAVGDPATDLHWLAAAAEAADDVHRAYAAASERSPDPAMRVRARLYAELEFARWLIHGSEQHRDDIVDDAVELLDALVEGLGDEAGSLRAGSPRGVDDALAVIASGSPVVAHADDTEPSTSMQTDAYDPSMLSLFDAESDEADDTGARSVSQNDRAETLDSTGSAGELSSEAPASDPDETAPLDLDGRIAAYRAQAADGGLSGEPTDSEDPSGSVPGTRSDADASAAPHSPESPSDDPHSDDPHSDETELQRASRAAIQRWASSSSE